MVFGPGRELMIGEVLRLHARAGLPDPARNYVASDRYYPVGRLFGDGYARQRDRFELARETYEGWRAKRGAGR